MAVPAVPLRPLPLAAEPRPPALSCIPLLPDDNLDFLLELQHQRLCAGPARAARCARQAFAPAGSWGSRVRLVLKLVHVSQSLRLDVVLVGTLPIALPPCALE